MASLRLALDPETFGQLDEVLNPHAFAFCSFNCPGERPLSVIAFCKSLDRPLVSFVFTAPTSPSFTVKNEWMRVGSCYACTAFSRAVLFPIKKSISCLTPSPGQTSQPWRRVLSEIPGSFSFLRSVINLTSWQCPGSRDLFPVEYCSLLPWFRVRAIPGDLRLSF